MKIDKEILFLKESNAIEDIWDEDSLQQAVYAWKFLKKEKKLTTGVILKTHKILMLHQKLWPNEKGYFRKEQVWIGGHEGKPWFVVPELIAHWAMNATDVVVNGQHEDIGFLQALIIKHHVDYESIHPFIDGNGRTGRMFYNWQRIKVGLPIDVIKENQKMSYYTWFEK